MGGRRGRRTRGIRRKSDGVKGRGRDRDSKKGGRRDGGVGRKGEEYDGRGKDMKEGGLM